MGRPVIYPWDEWFDALFVDRRPLQLTHGTDFQVSVRSFRGGLLNEAKRRGHRVRTFISGLDEDTLNVIAVKRSAYPWHKWLEAGSTWVIVQGRDFVIPVDVMLSSLRRAAAKQGLRIVAQSRDEQIMFTSVPKLKEARRQRGHKLREGEPDLTPRGDDEDDREWEAWVAYCDSNALEPHAVRSDIEP